MEYLKQFSADEICEENPVETKGCPRETHEEFSRETLKTLKAIPEVFSADQLMKPRIFFGRVSRRTPDQIFGGSSKGSDLKTTKPPAKKYY